MKPLTKITNTSSQEDVALAVQELQLALSILTGQVIGLFEAIKVIDEFFQSVSHDLKKGMKP